MTPARRRLGLLLGLSLLLSGCAGAPGAKPSAEAPAKPDLATSLYDAGNTALAQNDASSATAYFRSAYARQPDNIAAAVGLMRSLRLTGGLEEARAVAATALSTAPEDASVLAEIGKVKLANGQTDDAIKLLQQADAKAKDWQTLSALGLAYDRTGDYARADANYAAALELSPENAAVLNNYGLSRAMAGDLPGARALLLRAVSARGADLRMRQNLALVYALSGNMAKAEELTRRDLPPALVGQTLDYYRELAAAATPRPAQ
jgi:Flp pilus assembly protein TadD